MNNEVILNEDVYSNFNIADKDRRPYGKRLEKVTIVFESLPALIVENKRGERFSVNVSKVTFKT